MPMGGEELLVGQIRAARAWLGLTQGEVAESAALTKVTVARYETEVGGKGGRERAERALVSALERCGARFVEGGVVFGEKLGDVALLPESRHLRAARAYYGLNQKMLAERSGISVGTLRRMEGSSGPYRGMHHNILALGKSLEALGVICLENGILFEAPDHADGG